MSAESVQPVPHGKLRMFRFRLAWLFLLMIAAAFAWNRAKRWYEPPLGVRQPFSVALLQKHRREGRPVLVQLYAPWSLGSAITRNWLDKPSSREVLASKNIVLLEYDVGPVYPSGTLDKVSRALRDVKGGDSWLWLSGGIVLFPIGPLERESIRLGGDKDHAIPEREMLIAIDCAARWP